MKRRSLKNTWIALSFLLPASAFLILQLSGTWRLAARSSSEPMPEGLRSSRLIAEHPPVELVEKRDDHTRVWEIVREVEITHPDGTVTVDTVKSYIHEKASGLCYKDGTDNYVPSVAEWRETPDGFVIDRCPYRLAMGRTIGVTARYTVEGNDLFLRPTCLIISDGVNQGDLATLNPETPGFISPDDPSVLRFPSAFGEGYDLEYVAEKGGFHQNLIITAPPELPAGFDAENTSIHLYTEINLDQYLTASACEALVEGEPINAMAADLVTEPSRDGAISFAKDGRVLHAFSVSQVMDSSGPGALDKQTSAEKRFMKDASSGKAYLVESVPLSYFSDNSRTYPITWDYESKTGAINEDETWEPRYTYRITGNVTVSATLTILPGTTVKLDPSTKITISTDGTVIARGEPYNYITFTRTRDNNCGEIITGPADQAYDRALQILSGSSPSSVVQYCKFGGGSLGVDLRTALTESLKHNIFNGMTTAISIVSCTATVHNNLITYCSCLGILGYGASSRTFSNNTIDHTSEGIWDTWSTSLTITDNLFSDCTWGISTDNYNALISHNGFYEVSGGQTGSSPVELTEDPYASSGIGNYFLNDDEGGGADLKDAGSQSAADAGFASDVFTVEPPESVATGTRTEPETWGKIASDTGTVDIGYHHCRVDCYVEDDVTFSGANASLTISPGVAVAVAGQSFWIYTDANLTCVGDPLIEGYNILTNSRSTSMHIQSARFGGPNPSFYIHNFGSDEIEIRYTRIMWFMYGLRTYRTVPGCSIDNVFALNNFGFVSDGCTNVLLNNLFYRNWYGVGAWGCDCHLYNNTFDTNNAGIYYQRSADRTLTTANNLFTDFTPSGLSAPPAREGIALYGPQEGNVVHDYNAFYGNAHNIYDHQSNEEVPIGDHSRALQASPYYQKKTGWEACWLLKQTPDQGEDPEDVLAVNAGSFAASEARMDEFTTSVEGERDAGDVDIGFHHPLEYEYVDLRVTDLFGSVAASRERYDGAYVHYNLDDDNADGDYVADYTEGYVENEDDLKLLQIVVDNSLTSGIVVLTRDNATVQVWRHPHKGVGNGILTGDEYEAGVEGNGKKTWDLSDPDDRDAVKEPVYVEGRGLGTALLKVTYTNGQMHVEDSVKYWFIGATCGPDHDVPQPDAERRADLEEDYPKLVGCEWSVTDPKPPLQGNYDCVAWSVGRTDKEMFTFQVIDQDYGNKNWMIETIDFDMFYAHPDQGGYVATSNINDADIILYRVQPTWHPRHPDGITHAARRVGLDVTSGCECGAGKWIMFESKLNVFRERIEHRPYHLTAEAIGYPFRYYRKE